MRYHILLIILLFLSGIGGCNATILKAPSSMQNISTVDNLVNFVNEAVIYAWQVGKDKALNEFANPTGDFTRGNVYVWAYNFSGVNLAHPFHPDYLGNNKLSLTDSNGFHMIAAMQDAAKNGSGFVSYIYEDPVSGKNESKLAYVKKVDDTWWLGSGIYVEGDQFPSETPELVRDKLKKKVDDAVSYSKDVGKESALAVFNNKSGEFTQNGSYIFAFDINGKTLAMPFHPENVGLNEKNLTDINGVSIGGEKLRLAGTGGGFWYYVYDNPAAGNKPEFKVSYIRSVDGNWVIGTGIYLSDIPVGFSSEKKETMVRLVKKASGYVKEHGEKEAIAEFNRPNGSFSDRNMNVRVYDRDGRLVDDPYLPGMVGVDMIDSQDQYGKYPVRQLISNAENGGGFTYYFDINSSDYSSGIKLAYSEPARDLVLSVGISPE